MKQLYIPERLAFKFFARKEYDKAEFYYTPYVILNPQNIEAKNCLAFSLAMLQRYGEAEQMYFQALALDIHHVRSLRGLATLYYDLGDYTNALKNFELVLDVDPNDYISLSFSCVICGYLHQEQKGRAYFDRIPVDSKNQPLVRYMFAMFLFTLKNFEEAIENIRIVHEQKPDFGVTTLLYGQMLEKVGKREEAAKVYRGALDREPQKIECQIALGLLLFNAGKMEDARNIATRSLGSTSLNIYNYGNLAILLDGLEKYEEAEKAHLAALKFESMHAHLYLNFGLHLLFTQKKAEAEKMLDKSDQLESKVPNPAVRLEILTYKFLMLTKTRDQRANLLTRIRETLPAPEFRTETWEFTRLVALAVTENHPDSAYLESLIEVISGRKDPEILKGWELWDSIQCG